LAEAKAMGLLTKGEKSKGLGTVFTVFNVATATTTMTTIVFDQTTKWIVLGSLKLQQPTSVINGLLDFRLQFNPNGAFGLLAGLPPNWRLVSLSVLSILAMIVVITFSIRAIGTGTGCAVSLGLFVGGGISNIIDRFFRSGVVDFLNIHFGNHYQLPTFNLADMAITTGLILILISWTKKRIAKRVQGGTFYED
jgi:signal peptidase II